MENKTSTIGPFQYPKNNLSDIETNFRIEELFKSLYQFYVPISLITFQNNNVVDRLIWVSEKRHYCSASDIATIIIHSSNYIPHKAKFKKEKQPLGALVSFEFLNERPSKYDMRRKNGIRSRYSSKEIGFVVSIKNFQFIFQEKRIPLRFSPLAKVSKKTSIQRKRPHNTSNRNQTKTDSKKKASNYKRKYRKKAQLSKQVDVEIKQKSENQIKRNSHKKQQRQQRPKKQQSQREQTDKLEIPEPKQNLHEDNLNFQILPKDSPQLLANTSLNKTETDMDLLFNNDLLFNDPDSLFNHDPNVIQQSNFCNFNLNHNPNFICDDNFSDLIFNYDNFFIENPLDFDNY
ncbi:double-stranded RNA-binding protein [Anaeramoeba flamelloides]|uniref:Double-stranded RNA-binding protein n=1 Tax=Anaeramoeba flamelloides TaxID=1746091 RepID=A0AAV7YK91_9EUKA|nr:double-stranded RNA-binding protein [Anaeramoeba flamelloides]